MATVECIIKLGGSAITKKEVFETPVPENISRAADIIAGVKGKCIIVHGAGSFGHFQASEYRVAHGYNHLGEAEQTRVKEGLCKTRLSVTKLNHLVVQTLVDRGINAVGCAVCRTWKTCGRSKVIENDCDRLAELLEADFVPVLFGDSVLDQELGCTILGGDAIIEVLSDYFKPKRVVFLSDVNGIYTKPPADPDAILIPRIQVQQDGGIATSIATSNLDHDVTGGIKTKIASACSIVVDSRGATPVFICSLGGDAAMSACWDGEESTFEGGTLIHLDDR